MRIGEQNKVRGTTTVPTIDRGSAGMISMGNTKGTQSIEDNDVWLQERLEAIRAGRAIDFDANTDEKMKDVLKSINEYHREVLLKREWNIENVDPSFTGERCAHCGLPIKDEGLILNAEVSPNYEGKPDIHFCNSNCLCSFDYTAWKHWDQMHNPWTEEEYDAFIARAEADPDSILD